MSWSNRSEARAAGATTSTTAPPETASNSNETMFRMRGITSLRSPNELDRLRYGKPLQLKRGVSGKLVLARNGLPETLPLRTSGLGRAEPTSRRGRVTAAPQIAPIEPSRPGPWRIPADQLRRGSIDTRPQAEIWGADLCARKQTFSTYDLVQLAEADVAETLRSSLKHAVAPACLAPSPRAPARSAVGQSASAQCSRGASKETVSGGSVDHRPQAANAARRHATVVLSYNHFGHIRAACCPIAS